MPDAVPRVRRDFPWATGRTLVAGRPDVDDLNCDVPTWVMTVIRAPLRSWWIRPKGPP